MSDAIKTLGPLAPLVGSWEGAKGNDVAPSDDRGTETNSFRERICFQALSPVQNHEQILGALRYSTTAWRLGESDPFHEEVGYWLWDAARNELMRSFMVPRGVVILAGGTVEPQAKTFSLVAELGSPTYGICSNRFLHDEFRTVRYELVVRVDVNLFHYEEDTQLQIKGQKELFHHRDSNTLARIVAS